MVSVKLHCEINISRRRRSSVLLGITSNVRIRTTLSRSRNAGGFFLDVHYIVVGSRLLATATCFVGHITELELGCGSRCWMKIESIIRIKNHFIVAGGATVAPLEELVSIRNSYSAVRTNLTPTVVKCFNAFVSPTVRTSDFAINGRTRNNLLETGVRNSSSIGFYVSHSGIEYLFGVTTTNNRFSRQESFTEDISDRESRHGYI